MAKVTGLSTTTPDYLLLDTGAFFKNFSIGTDTPATASSKCLGATDGGGTFSAIPTVRQVSVDGGKTNVKGLQTIDEWVITLSVNVKEITAANIKLACGGATSTSSTTITSYTEIKFNDDFTDDDYVDNITWVGTLKGSTKPIYIQLTNAISLNGFTLAVADKSEATVPITLTANYDLADLDAIPAIIYYPPID